jgi:hypothetical protein
MLSCLLAVNTYLFSSKQELERLFETTQDSSVNFSEFLVGAIVMDNKVGGFRNGKPGLYDTPLSLSVDTTYIKNCALNIPFSVILLDTVPVGIGITHANKPRFFLFKIPKHLGVSKVNFIGLNAAMTNWYLLEED